MQLNLQKKIEDDLIQSAKDGFTGYEVCLSERKDKHILINERFLKKLRLLLDGCDVKIKQKQYTSLLLKNKYHKYFLVINWK